MLIGKSWSVLGGGGTAFSLPLLLTEVASYHSEVRMLLFITVEVLLLPMFLRIGAWWRGIGDTFGTRHPNSLNPYDLNRTLKTS